MDEKINLQAVKQYCNEYADRILDDFFAQKERITGAEILSLCDIRQINLFIIGELFKSWKQENAKIESPYFDYEAQPVKEALENLMSALSNNISIDRAHFAPLLKAAVYNTMLLIMAPYDFFANFIEGDAGELAVAPFREQLKYLKVNQAPLARLLQKLEEKNLERITGTEAFGMLDQILEEVNFTPADIEEYIRQFSTRFPLSIERFFEAKAQPIPRPEPEPEAPTPPPTPTPRPAPTHQPAPMQRAMRPPQPAQNTPKPTINDKLSSGPKTTLADNFKKIARIKDSLTINQKFMFTKVLFHGDFELFSKAIDDLDRQDNMNGALRYLEMNYEEWDRESEEFHEFMELLEMRFA